jgi:hypothetical protein
LSDTNENHGGNEKSQSGGRRWPLFVGLPLIVLVAVAAVLFSGAQERPSGTAERPSGAGSGEEASGDSSGLGTPALGSADAPVVMTEYGDFQ